MAIFGGQSAFSDIPSMVNGGIDAANGAVANVNNQVNAANATINEAKGLVGKSVAEIGNMKPYVNELGAQAKALNSTAASLEPSRGKLSGYADELAKSGMELRREGTGFAEDANALMRLDSSRNGIVGKYVDNINAFDPNYMVSRAASDAQAARNNAVGQLTRALSRSGASSSSGNAMAAKAQLERDYLAILAGAKTNARTAGYKEQNTVLRNALSDALALQGRAAETISAGNTATAGAANAEKGAADVGTQIGDLQYKAGALYDSAGNMVAKMSALYNDAAGTENQLAGTQLSAANAITNAAKLLQDAYGAGLDGARILAGGGGGGGGSSRSSSSGGKKTESEVSEPDNGGWELVNTGKASMKWGELWGNQSTGDTVFLQNA